ncbi:MAG: MarR family transcriptional regulator [Actinomycetota bacterium]|nr:MarR family transcriptional regulator [Actinomycetota bacterium]
MPEPPVTVAEARERLGRALDTLVRFGASRRLHQRQASAAGTAISQQGFRLLRVIDETGPITPTELARLTRIDPAVVTRQCRTLADDGLISRARDEADGRLSTLAATDLGHQTVQRMRLVLNQHMQVALERWGESDVATLANLLERLEADLRAIPYPDLPTEP